MAETADPADAADAADAADTAPLEAVLRLGALGRLSALAAAGGAEAESAVLWAAPLLQAARPVARMAALRLADIGLLEGPLGRRARAVLEEGLSIAIEGARAADRAVEEVDEGGASLEPGLDPEALLDAAMGRIVDLVGVLGGLAAHREGLTQRLSALAPQVPAFAGPAYVTAYLAALGSVERGPYLREVRHRLERAAADADARVRALAVDALGYHASIETSLAAVLESALTDADPDVRTAAALALGEVGAASDAAVRELAELVRLGGLEESLAAVRALIRCGRPVPPEALADRDDPVLRAAAALLERPADGAAFEALLAARADADADVSLEEAMDERVRPRDLLIEALRMFSLERVAAWLARFAAGEVPAIGEVWFHVLDVPPVPGEPLPAALVEAGAPLIEVIAGGDEERASLAALVASRLAPEDPRLEALILAHTSGPAALIALGALAHLSADTAEDLLAIAGAAETDPAQAALAIEALGLCALPPERARAIGAILAAHVRDGDPLAEAAHAALLELVERGVLTA